MTLSAGSTELQLTPAFRPGIDEYSAVLPASVSGSGDLTVTFERSTNDYTVAGVLFGDIAAEDQQFVTDTLSSSGGVSSFRQSESHDIVVTLEGTGVDDAVYTITVTVET